MALKRRNQTQSLDVNLVPMMDVILTILTFFIIVSMTLNNQQVINVTLPSADKGVKEMKLPDPLVVGLNTKNQILLKNQPVSEAELTEQMQTYLAKNPKGAVLLKADEQVSYQQLAKLLGKMQSIGGEQVSLAIQK